MYLYIYIYIYIYLYIYIYIYIYIYGSEGLIEVQLHKCVNKNMTYLSKSSTSKNISS